jgi:hypothetical protein
MKKLIIARLQFLHLGFWSEAIILKTNYMYYGTGKVQPKLGRLATEIFIRLLYSNVLA